MVIRCHCLAHGRRQFSDIEEVFPRECRVVIDALKQVFDHDEEAREQQMSPEARLAYHQAYSQPLMDELKRGSTSRSTIAWWNPIVPWARPSPICRPTGKR